MKQFIKFGMVGVTNTLLSYFLNIGVLYLLKDAALSYDYVIANVVAFFISVLWSFYWNNRLVFDTKQGTGNILKALLKTYVAYSVTGIVLNNILSFVWIDLLGISKLIAPMINLLFSVPINFLLNKYWAFKE